MLRLAAGIEDADDLFGDLGQALCHAQTAAREASFDLYVVIWQTSNKMKDADMFQALSNDRRLQVLEWLKQPRRHFPPQVDGDLIRDGVCACSIADKLRISQPTLSEHMRILSHAGLVEAKRIKRWTFYKRNEKVIAQVRRTVSKL